MKVNDVFLKHRNILIAINALLFLNITSVHAQEQAKSADGFVDFLGVNTHVGETTGPYASLSTVQSELLSLGVRHIRETTDPPATTAYINNLKQLASSGIHTDLVVDGNWYPVGAGGYPNGYGTTALSASALVPFFNSLSPAIDGVEAGNETDASTQFKYLGQSFPAGTIQFGKDLYSIFKAAPSLSSIPVILTSVADDENSGLTNEYSFMTQITPGPVNYADWGNMHCYSGGENPGYAGQWLNLSLSAQLGWLLGSPSSPGIAYGKPFADTETGYANYSDQWGIDLRTGGLYTPRLVFEHFNAGEQRCLLYELYDDTSQAGREAHFGLLNSNSTPKPAFTALQNVIGILHEPGASFTPGSLTYTLSAPSTVHHTLLQKSNGDYFLVLWNEVSSYNLSANGATSGDITNAKVPVTLTLPTASAFSVYAPNDANGQQPTTAYNASVSSTTLSLNVPDQVLIVQIRPQFATGSTHPYYLSNQYTGGYMNCETSFICAPYLAPGYWSQEWFLLPTGSGSYYLQNAYTGNAINMQSGFACSSWWSGEASAFWTFASAGNGSFYINNPYTSKGINTEGSTFECTSTWGGEVSAMWNIIPVTN